VPTLPSLITAATKTLTGASASLGGQVALTVVAGSIAASGVFTAATGHLPFTQKHHDNAGAPNAGVRPKDNGVTTVDGNDAAPVNRLSIPVSGLIPGGSAQRAIDYAYRGDSAVTMLALNTKAQQSTALDTDRDNGVQLRIDECSKPWTEATDLSYTCMGQSNAVTETQPIIGVNRVLSNSPFSDNKPHHYRFTVSLPKSADTSMAGLTSVVQYDFIATRDGGQS
jgi:spore coat-associated protein N